MKRIKIEFTVLSIANALAIPDTIIKHEYLWTFLLIVLYAANAAMFYRKAKR